MPSYVILAGIVTAFIAAACLIAHPFGPLGHYIWPPSPICPKPSDALFPFFAFVALTEATAFGLGISWVIFGYRFVARWFTSRWRRLAVFVGIAWHLLNWYPHDSLHMNVGVNLKAMLALELGFHVTMIVATCAMALALCLPRKAPTR